jgi:hypothetical protein
MKTHPLVVACCCLLFSCAITPRPGEPGAPTASLDAGTKPGAGVVCRDEMTTGSRIPTRVCRKATAEEEDRDKAQDWIRRQERVKRTE